MKLTSQDEYGLRCLLQIARQGPGSCLTIPQISRLERVSSDYVAKLLRILRRGGLVKSVRGSAGGYVLSRPAEEITVAEVLSTLGGRLFETGFCDNYSGLDDVCAHSMDCSIRSLWRAVQTAVDRVLSQTTLKDLICGEPEMISLLSSARTRATSGQVQDLLV